MSNGTQEQKFVTFNFCLCSSLYKPISHTCCLFPRTDMSPHLPTSRESWKVQRRERTLGVLKSPINPLAQVAMADPTNSPSTRRSLVLPTTALIHLPGASPPIGHRETTYTTQSHARKCPDWPSYKNPSTTLLTSSKDLLDPEPAAKHLYFRLQLLCSSKTSVRSPSLNIFFLVLLPKGGLASPSSLHPVVRETMGWRGKLSTLENQKGDTGGASLLWPSKKSGSGFLICAKKFRV